MAAGPEVEFVDRDAARATVPGDSAWGRPTPPPPGGRRSRCFAPLGRALTGYENHKTDRAYENNLIVKVFVFDFVTSYSPLFYAATVKRQMPLWTGRRFTGCDRHVGGCFDEIRTQLAAIFIVRITLTTLFEVAVPVYGAYSEARARARGRDARHDPGEYERPHDVSRMRKRQKSPTEEQFFKAEYHHLLGTFDDYAPSSESTVQAASLWRLQLIHWIRLAPAVSLV